MPLNSSGQISLAGSTAGESIAVELGLSATGQITLDQANVRTLAGAPTAGSQIIVPTNFWGKSSVTNPTMTITRSGTGVMTAAQTITFTSNQATSNFIAGDITVTGGVLSAFTAVSSTVYTATFTPTANISGTNNGTINVAAGAYTATTGGLANLAASLTFSIDTVRPTVTANTTSFSLGIGGTATITFTTSESTSNFISSDITISPAGSGSITSFTGSGTSYTAVYTPPTTGSGTITLSIPAGAFTDANNNNNLAMATNVTVLYDNTRPVISTISSTSTNLFVGQTATLTFTANKALSAASFTSADVTITPASGTVGTISGSGTTYTAVYTPPASGTGTVTIGVTTGSFTDTFGNANNTTNGTVAITYGTPAPSNPSMSISRSGTGTLLVGGTSTITFTSSETPSSSTTNGNNFVSGDVTVIGGAISALVATADPKIFTATFTPTANTNLSNATLSVAANRYVGATTGLSNTVSNTLTIPYDTLRPTATLARTGSTTISAAETLNISLSEAPASGTFIASDVSIVSGGGTLSNFTNISATTWSILYTPPANTTGTANIIINANTFTDASGNNNNQSNTLSIPYSTIPGQIINPIPFTSASFSADYTINGPNTSLIQLGIYNNGLAQVYDASTYGNFVIQLVEWFRPWTLGIANNNYWVRFTLQSSSLAPSGGGASGSTGWLGFSSTVTSHTMDVIQYSSPGQDLLSYATYLVEISSNSSGTNIVTTDTITLYARAYDTTATGGGGGGGGIIN